MSPAERGTELLAAIPFADSRGRMWAVLAVREMLFVAFHADNLKLLAVLGGHVGDILAYGAGWSSADDSTRASFLVTSSGRSTDRSRFDLPAVLVAMAFSRSERAEALAQQILGARRGLDQALLLRSRPGRDPGLHADALHRRARGRGLPGPPAEDGAGALRHRSGDCRAADPRSA